MEIWGWDLNEWEVKLFRYGIDCHGGYFLIFVELSGTLV